MKLKAAQQFWDAIENEILQEAERLDNLKKTLKAADPLGTAALLQEIGMPDTSPLEEEIATLPLEIVDLVEQVGDCEVEISFSLSAYPELQRNAMGVPVAAQTLSLRLFIDHSGTMPPTFCLHFNSEVQLDQLEHTPLVCAKGSKSPQNPICNSTQTAFIWQLNRQVHTQLCIGNVQILGLYQSLKRTIEEMSHACISCGIAHKSNNARLRRSTPCDVLSCTQLW